MRTVGTLALLLGFASACDPKSSAGDSGEASSTDTGNGPSEPDDANDDPTTLVFTATDYTVYSLGTLDLATRRLRDSLTTLPGDAVIRHLQDGRIYNLNRFGYDVLRAYEPGEWAAPLYEVSLGDGSANPHDIVLCNDELWVSLYGRDTLLVLNPDTGVLAEAVDLNGFTHGSDVAEFDALYCRDDRIFAVAQQLDPATYISEGGTIVVVDAVTKSPIDSFDVRPNPKTTLHPSNPDMLLNFSGHYGVGDGAITTIDLTTGAESDPLAFDADYGVTFAGFAASGQRAVILGTNYDYTATKLFCVDLETWTITEGLTIDGYTGSVAGDGLGTAWLGMPTQYAEDGTGMESPTGLQPFDIEACTLDGPLIETTLTPSSMTAY